MLSRHYLLLLPHLIHLQDSLTDLQDSVTGLGTNGNMYPVLSVFFHALNGQQSEVAGIPSQSKGWHGSAVTV